MKIEATQLTKNIIMPLVMLRGKAFENIIPHPKPIIIPHIEYNNSLCSNPKIFINSKIFNYY